MIYVTVLFWVLRFTAPAFDADPQQVCVASADSCKDAASFEVWEHHQSPTWVAKREVMLASPDSFSVYWPTVRAEADYHFVLRRSTTPAEAGKAAAIIMPDSIANQGKAFVIITRDKSGNASCMSNERVH